MLINKMKQKLQDHSCEPRMQDALKAIQLKHKLAPDSEAEQIFWGLIDDIKRSEYEESYSEPSTKKSLKAQILEIIIGLKEEVNKGVLPVKTITDAFNRERVEQGQLTYKGIGGFLSQLGFTKVRTGSGTFAIVWDEELLQRLSRSHLGTEKCLPQEVRTSP